MQYIRLFQMIVGVLTTCHTGCTWDRSICVFLFNRITLLVFVKYLTGALYMLPLWFDKHQQDNRVRSMFVAYQRWWFQWRFWFVPSVPGYLQEEVEHKPIDPSVQLKCSYLKCIVYDKLLKPWQSLRITLYISEKFVLKFQFLNAFYTLSFEYCDNAGKFQAKLAL